MTIKEILERIQNVLNQNIFNQSHDLDLLRHDLENEIIKLRDPAILNETLNSSRNFVTHSVPRGSLSTIKKRS